MVLSILWEWKREDQWHWWTNNVCIDWQHEEQPLQTVGQVMRWGQEDECHRINNNKKLTLMKIWAVMTQFFLPPTAKEKHNSGNIMRAQHWRSCGRRFFSTKEIYVQINPPRPWPWQLQSMTVAARMTTTTNNATTTAASMTATNNNKQPTIDHSSNKWELLQQKQ